MSVMSDRWATMKEERAARFLGQTYNYATPGYGLRPIGVCKLLGECYIVAWLDDCGNPKRVSSTRLPPSDKPDPLQEALDQWAAERGLEGGGNGNQEE